jgi:WD40 repeat protein
MSAAFSADGRMLATGGIREIGEQYAPTHIWDPHTGRQLRVVEAHREDIPGLDFSPSGELLATAGGFDGGVCLWHVSSGTLLWSVMPDRNRLSVKDVAFSPDGTLLVTCSGNEVQIWGLP